MKKKIAILVMLSFFLLVIVPKHTMAGGAGEGALIGAGIGLVIGTIVYVISVASETPMDKQNPKKDTKQSSKSDNQLNAYFDDVQTIVPNDKTSAVKVNLFSFCVTF